MIWRGQEEFPGVHRFVKKMKLGIMSAHDSIIVARVVHTVQANRKQIAVTYKVGDTVYLSTKNISLPKGRARKLAPKYLGSFAVSKVMKEGATYQLDLSEELKRGINRSFHVSLLNPHVPNDDRRFPARSPSQLPGFGEKPDELIVNAIVAHHGKGIRSEFKILWKAGDQTWTPYKEVAHLITMDRYCELMGVEDPYELPTAYPKREDDHEVSVKAVRVVSDTYIRRSSGEGTAHLPTMAQQFSQEEWQACIDFASQLNQYLRGVRSDPPGPPPPRYPEYLPALDQHSASPNNPYNAMAMHSFPYGPPPNNQSNTVSMPPAALNHILNSQVRMVKLVAGQGTNRQEPPRTRQRISENCYVAPPRQTHPVRAPRGYYIRGGRGAYRGGRFGRPRPSITLSRRELREFEQDITMADTMAGTESPFPDMSLFRVNSNAESGPSSSSTRPGPSQLSTGPGTSMLSAGPGPSTL